MANISFETFALRGSVLNLLGRITGRVLFLLSQALLARLMTPFQFGLYAIGWNIFRTLGLFAPLGLDAGVIHFGMRYKLKDSSLLKTFIFLVTLLGVLSGVTFGGLWFAGADQLAQWLHKTSMTIFFRLFAVALPMYVALRILSAATRISKNMIYTVLAEEVVPGMVNIGAIWVLVGLAKWVPGSVLALALSFFGGAWLSWIFVVQLYSVSWHGLGKILKGVKSLLRFSFSVMIGSGLGSLFFLMDRLFVGYFLPPDTVGRYQTAALLTALFVHLLASLKVAMAPLVSEAVRQEDYAGLERTYTNTTRWLLIVVSPLVLLLLLAPRDIMVFGFGQNYAGAEQIMLILLAGQLLNLLTGVVDILLIMSGNPGEWVKVMLFSMGINVILQVVLIPKWGAQGAAWATAASLGLASLGGGWKVYRVLGIHPLDIHYLRVVSLLAVGGFAVTTINTFSSPLWLKGSLLSCSLAILGYALWRYGLKKQEQLALLTVLRR
ncbi:hypothetical protein D6779_00960 [Candidatus Parcubacteria bacterium]|nr:MAG: hypothetical protein D6779_00960 [Candidatus Parcubacteria bacterium]